MAAADSAARLIWGSQVAGVGVTGQGTGGTPGTWHLACGSVWRGLELITDHMHSEQTLTDTTIISTQQYLHSNINTVISIQHTLAGPWVC